MRPPKSIENDAGDTIRDVDAARAAPPSGSVQDPPRDGQLTDCTRRPQESESETDVQALKRSLDLRFEELGKLTRMLANCERKLEAATRDLLHDRIQLQSTRNSLSWRMTAPLRYVGALVKDWRDSRAGGDIALVGKSDLFDTVWYLSRYPDVAASGVDPVRHYLEIGAAEGRDPSAAFDTDWYLERNPDVVQAGMNPLVHYLRHGQAEWRLPRP
jgi:hypothetical protein